MFGIKNSSSIPGMGGNLKKMGKQDVSPSEKAPNGREWTKLEEETYYRSLRKVSWSDWFNDVFRLMYEKRKLNEQTSITPKIKEILHDHYKSDISPEQCADLMPKL